MIDQENQLREVAKCQKYSKTAAEVEKSDNFWRKYLSRTMSTICLQQLHSGSQKYCQKLWRNSVDHAWERGEMIQIFCDTRCAGGIVLEYESNKKKKTWRKMVIENLFLQMWYIYDQISPISQLFKLNKWINVSNWNMSLLLMLSQEEEKEGAGVKGLCPNFHNWRRSWRKSCAPENAFCQRPTLFKSCFPFKTALKEVEVRILKMHSTNTT